LVPVQNATESAPAAEVLEKSHQRARWIEEQRVKTAAVAALRAKRLEAQRTAEAEAAKKKKNRAGTVAGTVVPCRCDPVAASGR
jgi:hypothetical protein